VAIFWDNGISDFDEFETDSDIFIEGDGTNDEFGSVVVNLGDFDGDGVDDLGVGAPGASMRATPTGSSPGLAGKFYVFSGANISTVTDTGDAIVVVEGNDDYHIGENLSSVVDVNGDGLGDVVSFGAHATLPEVNMALLYGGSTVAGSMGWDDLDATWRYECGTLPSYSFYKATCDSTASSYSPSDPGGTDTWALSASGSADFNGDGYDDIAAGDKFYDGDGGKESGQAWVLFGKSIAYNHTDASMNSTATVVMAGSAKSQLLGGIVGAVPDVDGDGDDEIIIHDGAAGDFYFILGGRDLEIGSIDASDVDAVIDGAGSNPPTSIVDIGDWTGDGRNDFALAYSALGAGGASGEVTIIESKSWTGTVVKRDIAAAGIEGTKYNGQFGRGIAKTPGDLDGDGLMDLVIGDPKYDEDEDGAEGGLFIFYSTF